MNDIVINKVASIQTGSLDDLLIFGEQVMAFAGDGQAPTDKQ